MSAVLDKPAIVPDTRQAESLADLLARLGDIPPDRVRARPAPGIATEQDVLDLHDHEDRLYELVEGVLVEKPMGFAESRVALKLGQILEEFLEQHDLGIAAGADGMMRLSKGLVRIPDVSVVLSERLPGGKVPREPIPNLAPD